MLFPLRDRLEGNYLRHNGQYIRHATGANWCNTSKIFYDYIIPFYLERIS